MYAVRPDQLDVIDIANQNVYQVTEVTMTKCQTERGQGSARPGLFAPACDDDGNYYPKQW